MQIAQSHDSQKVILGYFTRPLFVNSLHQFIGLQSLISLTRGIYLFIPKIFSRLSFCKGCQILHGFHISCTDQLLRNISSTFLA